MFDAFKSRYYSGAGPLGKARLDDAGWHALSPRWVARLEAAKGVEGSGACMTNLPFDELIQQHAALTARAGLVDLRDRTQIEVTGEDRATFLHNMCTADIRRLTPGTGCEAFFCSAQGKILGYVYVFCAPESFVLETAPGQTGLMAHLDRFIIREKVELIDRTAEWGEFLLAGPHAERILSEIGTTLPEATVLAHTATRIGGHETWIRRMELTRPGGFLIACRSDASDAIRSSLMAAGAEAASTEAFDAARIEAGSPLYGRDITDENLPQEVGRNAQAISFTKGCYLGQETVARIDALGHVNRHLVGVRFAGKEIPAAGEELSSSDKVVGRVTSAAWSPRLATPLALAYVRRGHEKIGTPLVSHYGEAEVVQLPVDSVE
jgi:folate-binding protein YgfZ